MNFSGGKNPKKDVFDVSIKNKPKARMAFGSFVYGKNVINLRPSFRFRHPWVLTLIILVAIVGTFFGIKTFFTRGAVKDFYATTCLGNWQNPATATRIPETMILASSSFSADNSAMYNVSGTQIYCGGFVPPDFSSSGTLTSVTLNLVWQVGDTPYAPPAIVEGSSTTIAASSTTSDTSSTVSESASSTNESVAPSTPPSSDSSSPSAFFPLRSLFASIIQRAFAQDASSGDSGASDTSASPTDTVAPSSSPIMTPTASDATDTSTGTVADTSTIILSPLLKTDHVADSSTVSTSSSNIDNNSSSDTSLSSVTSTASSTPMPTSTQPVIAPPTAPDENFLQVSYSTDGQLWIQLAKVNIENWPNLTVSLPISNWGDLKNLQIKVQGIATTQDPVPVVYLDGMVVEAHYEDASDQPNATSTLSQFLTDKTSYTTSDIINIVGAPPASFIEIYSVDDSQSPAVTANVYGAQVNNLGETVLGSGSLLAGNYILVDTFEPSECNEYTITQCEDRSDYISQTPITVSQN